jgi:hypothetical protein
MYEIIIAILISIIAFIYFQKQKYIELPDVQENMKNVHVFKAE